MFALEFVADAFAMNHFGLPFARVSFSASCIKLMQVNIISTRSAKAKRVDVESVWELYIFLSDPFRSRQ